MQIAMEVNIETVLDEDDREVEERERFYRDAADDITAALESELYQFDVVHENYTLTLDLGTPWVVKEQGAACEGCDGPTGVVDRYVVDFEQGGLTVVRYCDGCADLARSNWSGEVRRFVGSIGGRVEKAHPAPPKVEDDA